MSLIGLGTQEHFIKAKLAFKHVDGVARGMAVSVSPPLWSRLN